MGDQNKHRDRSSPTLLLIPLTLSRFIHPRLQAGNCGYGQFQCDSSKTTLPGLVRQGGAPVTVSHHPAAQQLQQVR